MKRGILVVDDHSLFRASLRALLDQDPEFEIVGESSNGKDAIRAVGELAPRLVLMDLTMPGMNGVEAMTEIKRRYPEVRVLVMTAHRSEEFVRGSLQAGADGYILKDSTLDEFRLAVRTVLQGKTYLSADISENVASSFRRSGKSGSSASVFETLTHREREILKLVAEGKSNKEIADFLNLSVKTIEKHRSNLMAKLDVHNAAGLTAYAIEMRLVVK